MAPEAGIEPARPCGRQILRLKLLSYALFDLKNNLGEIGREGNGFLGASAKFVVRAHVAVKTTMCVFCI